MTTFDETAIFAAEHPRFEVLETGYVGSMEECCLLMCDLRTATADGQRDGLFTTCTIAGPGRNGARTYQMIDLRVWS